MATPPNEGPDAGGRKHLLGVEAAVEAGSTLFYPHELDSFGASNLDLALTSISVGPITIATIGYSSHVRISTDELQDGYQFNVPLHAPLSTLIDGRRSTLHPAYAAVYRPDETSAIEGWHVPDMMLAIKFDRALLEEHFAAVTGRSLSRLIPFDDHVDLTGNAARQWLASTRFVFGQGRNADALLTNPLMARSVSHTLMTGFLLAARPTDFDTDNRETASPTVERAVALVENDPTGIVSVADLARAVGVSARALQAGFRSHLRISPGDYIRQVRLQRAHSDLLGARPADTVASIAMRWGFGHLGRFAEAYAASYGELPSTTLRRAAR